MWRNLLVNLNAVENLVRFVTWSWENRLFRNLVGTRWVKLTWPMLHVFLRTKLHLTVSLKANLIIPLFILLLINWKIPAILALQFILVSKWSPRVFWVVHSSLGFLRKWVLAGYSNLILMVSIDGAKAGHSRILFYWDILLRSEDSMIILLVELLSALEVLSMVLWTNQGTKLAERWLGRKLLMLNSAWSAFVISTKINMLLCLVEIQEDVIGIIYRFLFQTLILVINHHKRTGKGRNILETI